MDNLKPCPFCGSAPEIVVVDECGEREYKVSCTKCFAKTFWETSEEEASRRWNERAEDG